jgi:hypothetical protein
MFKSNRHQDEKLDQAAKVILRVAAASEKDLEAAASSPFLFTRIRAAITEQQGRGEETTGWLSLFFVARRAVPAMVVVAVLTALITVLSVGPSAPAVTARLVDDEVVYGSREGDVERSVLADNSSLSRDEVFSLIVDRESGRSGK